MLAACMIAFQFLGGGIGGFVTRMGYDIRKDDITKTGLHPAFYYLCPGPPADYEPTYDALDNIKDGCNSVDYAFQAFVVEILATFLFVSVCCSFKNHLKPIEGGLAAIACAFGLFAATAIGYGHSGAALNPVIGFVQTVLGDYFSRQLHLAPGKADHLNEIRNVEYGYGSLWIYIVGPLLGGAIAGAFYKVTYEVQAKIRYDAKVEKAEQ